jgi:hypothetical protein
VAFGCPLLGLWWETDSIFICKPTCEASCRCSYVLCFSPWYKNEQGVETRRALGLMGPLALVSQYAARYMSGERRVVSDTEGSRIFHCNGSVADTG